MSQSFDVNSSKDLDRGGNTEQSNRVQRNWSKEEFHQVVESAPDAIILVGDCGQIVMVNAQTEQLFGYDRHELLGQPVELLMPQRFRVRHREHVFDYMGKPNARPMGAAMELHALHKNGNEFPVEISLSPVETKHGMMVSSAIRDVTARKQAEEELNRYSAELERSNRELQDFAYVVSHDLRAPLVNIQGFSKELALTCERLQSLVAELQVSPAERRALASLLDEDIPESLDFITTSSAKMDLLLAGVLQLSRVGRAALTIRPLDMNQMMAEIVMSMKFVIDEAGASVRVDSLPPCQGDQVQINQVFSNLLDNALKYLDPNRPGVINVLGQEASDGVVYSIEDNGLGIAAEYQDAIFKIFHRLDPQHCCGEGMGLTIVKRVVDRHEGKIWLDSEVNKGSKFFVSFPKQ